MRSNGACRRKTRMAGTKRSSEYDTSPYRSTRENLEGALSCEGSRLSKFNNPLWDYSFELLASLSACFALVIARQNFPMTAASPTSQQENKYSMTDQSMEEARQVRANHHQQEKKHKMAGQHSGKVARKGHAAASSTHTKAFLLRNITSMLLFTLVGFLLLMVSFEKKMHTHKKISKQDLRLQHTLKAIRGGASSHAKREMAKHQKAKVFNWKPLQGECRGIQTDPFPPSFDLKYYQKENGRGKTYQHYIEVGRSEGLNSSKGQRLKEFINTEILQNFTEPERQQDKGLILEIGPFLNPMLVGEGIKYFDILDLAGLEERAKQVGYPEIKKVPIDYVSPSGDLSVISEQGEFSLVVSSNVLLNQLSLVEHLKQVGNLLKDGGYYAMTVSSGRRVLCCAVLFSFRG